MSALAIERDTVSSFLHNSLAAARSLDFPTLLSPIRFSLFLLNLLYIYLQAVIIFFFKPPCPPRNRRIKYRGRVAVIGGGLTGVSSAAHAASHGFDVVLYEKDDRIGGIWAHVNSTSGLQLNSTLYRFHPAVLWSRAFPQRDEILGEIRRIWKEYGLEEHTRLGTSVTSVRHASPDELDNVSEGDLDPLRLGHARWIINGGTDGVFDAVIVTVGTCGEPQWVRFPGMPDIEEIKRRKEESQKQGRGEGRSDEKPQVDRNSDDDHTSESSQEDHKEGEEETFSGIVLHSSELDDAALDGKRVLVIGSGASGVEAVETALARGAQGCVIVARDDKWIIPRNMIVDTLISAQPFGREMPLSFLWEKIVTLWNYRGLEELTPARLGLFEGTPVVNDEFLNHVRVGRCQYIRGDTQGLTHGGVKVAVRGRMSRPGDKGDEREFPADIVVLATGFKKPKVDFLEEEYLFPEGYDRPNLYLQNFATEDWSVLMTNSSYINAIGTVGHFHIGIYTRILLTFLMDKNARPLPKDMKLWVDVLRFVKRGARGGALGFFTYMELTIWLLLFHILRLDRVKWLFFIMQGWGVLPEVEGGGTETLTNKVAHAANGYSDLADGSGSTADSPPISGVGSVNEWVKGE
ncbi:uncharacterized protein FIBRA_00890 [Fibroporia radiculosa]|uniref:FAD dependent oxidoreductase domain-containing protein n=1 Tax=Fibroporia radiculosa TaxID=599839 RepID=J4G0N7_9APHY|nr:uncharacterized protein FIBRA_00890 [Fibroporia radiculosa]CCL98883.1 predicted protein [Fibroporia radiculosa]